MIFYINNDIYLIICLFNLKVFIDLCFFKFKLNNLYPEVTVYPEKFRALYRVACQ